MKKDADWFEAVPVKNTVLGFKKEPSDETDAKWNAAGFMHDYSEYVKKYQEPSDLQEATVDQVKKAQGKQ